MTRFAWFLFALPAAAQWALTTTNNPVSASFPPTGPHASVTTFRDEFRLTDIQQTCGFNSASKYLSVDARTAAAYTSVSGVVTPANTYTGIWGLGCTMAGGSFNLFVNYAGATATVTLRPGKSWAGVTDLTGRFQRVPGGNYRLQLWTPDGEMFSDMSLLPGNSKLTEVPLRLNSSIANFISGYEEIRVAWRRLYGTLA
jgi:hypothetical protein